MNTPYEQHVEYPCRKRMAWLAAGAALLVCAGFFLFFDQSFKPGASFMSSVIALVSILFFGICFCYSLIRIIRREPSFVINEHGFVDSSISYISGGEVAWQDIKYIFMYELIGQKMIGVKLRDEKAFLERQDERKHKLMPANSNIVDATISIAQSSITLPLDQIYLIMMNHWRHARNSRG